MGIFRESGQAIYLIGLILYDYYDIIKFYKGTYIHGIHEDVKKVYLLVTVVILEGKVYHVSKYSATYHHEK